MEGSSLLSRLLVPATAAEVDILVDRVLPLLSLQDLLSLLCALLSCKRSLRCKLLSYRPCLHIEHIAWEAACRQALKASWPAGASARGGAG